MCELTLQMILLCNYCKKTKQFTTPFKDDIRQLADLKQPISQKMILLMQHIALMSLCCEVISSFVIPPVGILGDVHLIPRNRRPCMRSLQTQS